MKTLEERLREKALPYGARVLSGDTVLVKDALAIVADAPRITAAAIRDAGVTCGTCEHWKDYHGHGLVGVCKDPDSGYEGNERHLAEPDFFCAHHTLLTQPSEGKG